MKWIKVNSYTLPQQTVLAKRSFPGKRGGEELMVGDLRVYCDMDDSRYVYCEAKSSSYTHLDREIDHSVSVTLELWGITHYILWRDLIDLENDEELPVQQ